MTCDATSTELENLFHRAWVLQDASVEPELFALLPRLPDVKKARAYLGLARLADRAYDNDRCEHLLDLGIALAAAEEDTHTWLLLLNYRAYRFVRKGWWSDAVEMLVAILRRSRQVEDAHGHAAQAHGNLGFCLQMLGDSTGAAEAFEIATELAEASGNAYQRVQTLYGLLTARLCLGEHANARRVLAAMVATAPHADRPRATALTSLAQAQMSLVDQRFDDAYRLALNAAPVIEHCREPDELATTWSTVAEAALGLGEAETAATFADRALQQARTHSDSVQLLPVLRLRAQIARAQGDADAVFDLLTEATTQRATRASTGLARALRRMVEQHLEAEDLRDLELSATNEALHRANHSLQSARDTAQRAADAHHQFLSAMSHELRTPLQSVMATTEILADGKLNAEQVDLVDTIRRSANMTLAVVDDILDLRSLEAGRMSLDTESFPLIRPIEHTLTMLGARAAATGIALEVDIDPSLPAHVEGDERRLQQVLLNLASNAVKYTPKGRVTVSVTRAPSGLLRFEIADTGEGIATEQMPSLFEPFIRARQRSRRRVSGTGLGLAICKQLVDLFGGRIGAESELGRGSVFWFEAPFKQAQPAETAYHERASLDGLEVVVAEDNPVNRMLLVRMLHQAGAKVYEAHDGEQAVTVGRTHVPDVVLMDLHMPQLQGDEAARELRSHGYMGCIIALTASVMNEDRDACLASGMDGFLTKPLTVDKLTRTITSLLARRPAPAPVLADSAQGSQRPGSLTFEEVCKDRA